MKKWLKRMTLSAAFALTSFGALAGDGITIKATCFTNAGYMTCMVCGVESGSCYFVVINIAKEQN